MPVPDTHDDRIREGLERARAYRALAVLFRMPDANSVEELGKRDLPELELALDRLEETGSLGREARELAQHLSSVDLARLRDAYQETFEESGGLRCPPNETSHTAETPQQALVRTFELADVAGFYRAFALETSPGSERPDHIVAELEFMQLLAVKEAIARQTDGHGERAEICREAARVFLRDHLGRWAGRFAELVEESATHPVYAQAGRVLGHFVEFDVAQLEAA